MRNGPYELYPARNWRGAKRWRWRYRAANGQIIAQGEAYVRREDCMRAIEIMKASHSNPVIEVTA